MRLNSPTFVFLLTFITTLALVPITSAQVAQIVTKSRADSNDTATSRRPVLTENACAASCEVVSAERRQLHETQSDKIEHLRRAAKHLKAAGKTVLAGQVTKELLVEEKLAQIRKLQVELDQLRGASETERQVTLHVKVMELQLTKMRELGFEFQIPDTLGIFEGSLSTLKANDLIKVLAEPTLVTVSGRPAAFQSGGEFPIIVPQEHGKVAVEYRHVGTRLDCVPKVLENGRIRVELRPSVSEIDTSKGIVFQNTSVPGLRTRWVDTAVEVEAGQTLVLGGLTQSRPKADDSAQVEETALLMSVTADFAEPLMQAERKGAANRR